MSSIAGRHTGTVTLKNVARTAPCSDAETASNSLSICFNAVTAVRCEEV